MKTYSLEDLERYWNEGTDLCSAYEYYEERPHRYRPVIVNKKHLWEEVTLTGRHKSAPLYYTPKQLIRQIDHDCWTGGFFTTFALWKELWDLGGDNCDVLEVIYKDKPISEVMAYAINYNEEHGLS